MDFSPTTNCATDHQAQRPRMPLTPFPQPHNGLRPPQGSELWRKTGKPTKIFQIRQICGADKSCAGWDEVSVAPQWGGPIKSGLWPQKNASSPALRGAHCLRYPPKESMLGVPTVRELGVSPWPPGHPHGPAQSPVGGSRASQRSRGTPSLGCWLAILNCPRAVVPGLPNVW